MPDYGDAHPACPSARDVGDGDRERRAVALARSHKRQVRAPGRPARWWAPSSARARSPRHRPGHRPGGTDNRLRTRPRSACRRRRRRTGRSPRGPTKASSNVLEPRRPGARPRRPRARRSGATGESSRRRSSDWNLDLPIAAIDAGQREVGVVAEGDRHGRITRSVNGRRRSSTWSPPAWPRKSSLCGKGNAAISSAWALKSKLAASSAVVSDRLVPLHLPPARRGKQAVDRQPVGVHAQRDRGVGVEDRRPGPRPRSARWPSRFAHGWSKRDPHRASAPRRRRARRPADRAAPLRGGEASIRPSRPRARRPPRCRRPRRLARVSAENPSTRPLADHRSALASGRPGWAGGASPSPSSTLRWLRV